MTTQISGISLDLRPFTPKSTQAGGAHSAITDFIMAAQTEALHVQALRGRRSWFWASPKQAPAFYRDDTTASGFQLTETFENTNLPAYCPFLSHKGHTALDVRAVIVKMTSARLMVRARTIDLDTLGSATNGQWVEVASRIASINPAGWYLSDGVDRAVGADSTSVPQVIEGIYRVDLRVIPGTYGADRMVGVSLGAQWEPFNVEINNISQRKLAYIMSMQVSDTPIEDGPDA